MRSPILMKCFQKCFVQPVTAPPAWWGYDIKKERCSIPVLVLYTAVTKHVLFCVCWQQSIDVVKRRRWCDAHTRHFRCHSLRTSACVYIDTMPFESCQSIWACVRQRVWTDWRSSVVFYMIWRAHGWDRRLCFSGFFWGSTLAGNHKRRGTVQYTLPLDTVCWLVIVDRQL